MRSTGFCLSGFLPWKRVAFIPARTRSLSRSCFYLHSSYKPTCNARMDITPSLLRISPWQFLALRVLRQPRWYAHLLHFYLSSSIISEWASYMIGLSDARLLILTYGANYPLWSASVIWQYSLCFYFKPCVLDIIIMQHHATFPFRRLYWCAWHVASIMLIGFGSISPRYA